MINQEFEEKEIVDQLGEEYFNVPKDKFISLPDNMTASEYKEWRKGHITE